MSDLAFSIDFNVADQEGDVVFVVKFYSSIFNNATHYQFNDMELIVFDSEFLFV